MQLDLNFQNGLLAHTMNLIIPNHLKCIQTAQNDAFVVPMSTTARIHGRSPQTQTKSRGDRLCYMHEQRTCGKIMCFLNNS